MVAQCTTLRILVCRPGIGACLIICTSTAQPRCALSCHCLLAALLRRPRKSAPNIHSYLLGKAKPACKSSPPARPRWCLCSLQAGMFVQPSSSGPASVAVTAAATAATTPPRAAFLLLLLLPCASLACLALRWQPGCRPLHPPPLCCRVPRPAPTAVPGNAGRRLVLPPPAAADPPQYALPTG
jgi:hypothetical protein